MAPRWNTDGECWGRRRKSFQRFLSERRDRKELEVSCERQCPLLVIEGEMITEKNGQHEFEPLEGKERTSSSYLSPGGSTGTIQLGCDGKEVLCDWGWCRG